MSTGRAPHRTAYLVLQFAILGVCLFAMFDGRHPPANAQSYRALSQQQSAIVPVLTVEDALQDKSIEEINQHFISTDARVQKQWDQINENKTKLAALEAAIEGAKGEQRGIGGILSILAGSGVFLQLKGRNRKAASQ